MIFYDMRAFLIIFFIVVLSFSNVFYLLDYGNKLYTYDFHDGEADLSGCLPSRGKLVKDLEFTNNGFLNTFYYGYLLSLGEFQTDNFEGTKYPTLVWSVFLVATIALQIVFLNMIIAIMGDTFDKVMEQKERYSLGVAPDIYADYFSYLDKDPKIKQKNYLYVITFLDTD